MNKYIDDVEQDLVDEKLKQYWPGFKRVAYALYDEEFVYLFNHPKMTSEPNKKYQILKRDDQFYGCTLILYNDYPTAIVDLELYNDNASLYSILIHELFHGFQYTKEESRFANEIMGVTYPILKENIELRNQERTCLYQAVFEKNSKKKQQLLTEFIALREKRTTIINDYLQYENLIETIEGPAWYVELKAYSEKSLESDHLILKKFSQQLINKYESTANIRGSCYSSGLFICLLLDELAPDWKDHFWQNEVTLYDLLKGLSDCFTQINEVKVSPETDNLIDSILQARKNEIISFEQQTGYHLFIEGKITAKSFDPMNILLFEDRFLHKRFLKVEINNQDYLIRQHVIAYSEGDLRNISKLHLVLNNEPYVNIDSITIDGIGIIKGKYELKNGISHLFAN